VCVRACVCMSARIMERRRDSERESLCMCTFVDNSFFMYACLYACFRVCKYHMYACTDCSVCLGVFYIQIRVCMCVLKYACLYLCLCTVCMYACVYVQCVRV